MPNLLILNSGPDTAGVGINLKRAFDKCAPGWTAHSVSRGTTYLAYEPDVEWDQRRVAELVRAADVIHVMDSERALLAFPTLLRGKRIVVQYLGSHFRRDPLSAMRTARRFGAVQVTDSIDLVRPGVAYFPVAMPEMPSFRVLVPHDPRIRIAHAPTNREIKDTDLIIETVNRLATRYPIDFDLIEGVSNAECLTRKGEADVFVDQLRYGFGLNAIECWAMTIPVVSGWAEDAWRQRSLDLFGRLPWADATPQTLESVVEHLILDAEWRERLATYALQHVVRWHSPESVVQRCVELYHTEPATRAAYAWQDAFG